METKDLKTIGGKVNVTVHKSYLKHGNGHYTRVQRTTASMGNVIALIASKTKLFDEAALVAAQMLFKEAILTLLAEGKAVDVFEVGILYPSFKGSFNGTDIEEGGAFGLKFTPSEDAVNAVQRTDVSATLHAKTDPLIYSIEDLFTHTDDFSITRGKPCRITGSRVKIAGADPSVGLYFAPQLADGSCNNDASTWIKIEESYFFKNTDRFLEFTVPETLKTGASYFPVIKTQAGRGTTHNKTVRSSVSPDTVLIR